MKALKVSVVSIMAAVFLFSTAFAADAEKGKTLFNDPKLGNGVSGKSCNSCHADGKGLEQAGDKKEFLIMGKKLKSLEDAINVCIEAPLKAKALDPKSADMANLATYIKSLKRKASGWSKKRSAAGY